MNRGVPPADANGPTLALAYEPVRPGGDAESPVRIARGGRQKIEGLSTVRMSRFVASALEVTPEIGWRLCLFGTDVEELGPVGREAARARIALLPASGGLLSSLNAWENILLPLGMHRPAGLDGATLVIGEGLEALGIAPDSGLLEKLPESMNRYEKILVAFLRIFLERPDLVLCENLREGLDDVQRAVVDRFPEVYRAHCPDGTFAIFGPASGTRDESADPAILLH